MLRCSTWQGLNMKEVEKREREGGMKLATKMSQRNTWNVVQMMNRYCQCWLRTPPFIGLLPPLFNRLLLIPLLLCFFIFPWTHQMNSICTVIASTSWFEILIKYLWKLQLLTHQWTYIIHNSQYQFIFLLFSYESSSSSLSSSTSLRRPNWNFLSSSRLDWWYWFRFTRWFNKQLIFE